MNQITKLISGLSIKQRVTIVMATVLAGLLVASFVHWKHESDFSALYTGMAPEDAGGVVQKLKEIGVEYRLADGGGTVRVPAARLAESRLALAAAGLPKTGRIGFELFDKSSFGNTDFVEHVNYKRALEGELERSVMSLAEVEQARVHLTLPKESVFLDQQQPSKASVVVKLRPGARISPQNVLAITNLVASAVEGLSPDSVSVVDMRGALLTRTARVSTDGSQPPTELLEMRQQMEHNLAAKISETLDPLLGPNNYRVGASVDCDMTSGEQQEEVLDPAHSVMVSSQKSEDVSERGGSSGIPGTAANLPGSATPVRTAGGVSRRTESINYQTSRTVRHTKIPQGIIKRMSLAILLAQAVRWEGSGQQKHAVAIPQPPETIKTIRDLVAGVTGFSAERGDQLVVETLPFESSTEPPAVASPVAPPEATPVWQKWLAKYRIYVIAGAALLALLTIAIPAVLVLKRSRRRTIAVSHPDELEGVPEFHHLPTASTALATPEQLTVQANVTTREDSALELAKRVREFAKAEPALTANTLRMWLQNQPSKAESQHASV
ncbi:MAG TPA: flagellar basal-body MS-ring/collar protein FliF [Bryobacteraceae bacterium]|nr:flagellar basal-body MS-ring/collar protein FliF [Bryobacteraceae bacterium]